MSDEGRLAEETLFLACTRPAMFAGVTVEAMAVNMMVTTLLFLALGSIFYASIGIAIHLIFLDLPRFSGEPFALLSGRLGTLLRT
jgi:type IV secretion system protein VirB3